MQSYESTLAFSNGRRISRLLSSIFQPATSAKSNFILLSFCAIFFLLSSVTAAQEQLVNYEQISSSLISTNGTPTATTVLFNSTRSDELLHSANLSQTQSSNTAIITRRVFVIIICSLISLFTIIGNLVVILTVFLVRKLQTASNILIVSLAVSDVFVGLIVMPLAMVPEIAGKWILGTIMCDIWTSTDVLLCTASILNFLVISIDRYFIINHPFKYAPMRKVKLLSLMIAGVWILSALVSLPPNLGWGHPNKRPDVCEVNPELEYQLFATSLSFYIPLIVVLIIYANIYRTAQSAMDTRSSVQMSQFLTHNNSSNNIAQTTGTLSKQQSNGNSCSSPQLFLNVSNANNTDDTSSLSGGGGRRSTKRSGNSSRTSKGSSFLSPVRCLGRRISTPFNGRLSIFVTRRTTFFRHVHLPNQKAIRTLGVILGTFIVCWLPFMLFAIIKPAHVRITKYYGNERKIKAPDWLDAVFLWFGYTSAMLNPIIYSKFNREFRTPFREIMSCRCKGLNEKIRRQEYLENLYGENHLQLPVPAHLNTSARTSAHPEAAV